LYNYIKNTREDIPSEIVLKLAKDISSGMNMIHTTGIVHRDLKSSVSFSFSFSFSSTFQLYEELN